MGIFDFFGKKKSTEAQPNDKHPHANHSFAPTSSQKTLETKPKRTLGEIINYDFASLRENEYDGRIVLDNELFGFFHYLDVVKFVDGKPYNVTFTSLYKRFNVHIKEFINNCVATFGKTRYGEGLLTPLDEKMLLIGRFSRLWDNVWFECGPDSESNELTALRFTVFNIDSTLNTIIREDWRPTHSTTP